MKISPKRKFYVYQNRKIVKVDIISKTFKVETLALVLAGRIFLVVREIVLMWEKWQNINQTKIHKTHKKSENIAKIFFGKISTRESFYI